VTERSARRQDLAWLNPFCLGVLLAGPAAGQGGRAGAIEARPELSRRIDALFANYDHPHRIGGVVAVVHRGEVIHLKGYGAAQREFDVRWSPDTRYRLASITKSLVATAVLFLEKQGRLRLDDPVRKYLPDFPDFGTPITLDHLLTMTSGLWQDETLLALASLRGTLTVDDMYQLSKRQRRLNYPPGSAMTYTDTNYRLLARVMAAVTGKTFWDAIRDVVFAPLGMTASLADPSLHHFYDGQAPTYLGEPTDSAPPLVNVPFHTSGDGSVITTMRDLVRWLQFLRADSDKAGSFFQRMTKPFRLGDGVEATYRRGIASLAHRGMIGWTHGGFTGTSYIYWPEIDLIVAVFANQLGALAPARVGVAITDLFLESEGRPTTGTVSEAAASGVEPKTGPLSPVDLARLSGIFVERDAGYVLASEPLVPRETGAGAAALRYNFLGTEIGVAKAAPERFVTPALDRGLRLEVKPVSCNGCPSPDLDVRQGGWPTPRRFARVKAADTTGVRLDHYLGHYFLDPFQIHYTVKRGDRGLTLEIGAGVQTSQILHLRPLGRDVFWARSDDPEQFDLFGLGRVSVKFRRDAGGRVTGLRFTTDRVRDLELVKVR
jgi:CubicO group peptidase (beta-lactamase class C family)